MMQPMITISACGMRKRLESPVLTHFLLEHSVPPKIREKLPLASIIATSGYTVGLHTTGMLTVTDFSMRNTRHDHVDGRIGIKI